MTLIECSEEGCDKDITCYSCVTCLDHCSGIERINLDDYETEEAFDED